MTPVLFSPGSLRRAVHAVRTRHLQCDDQTHRGAGAHLRLSLLLCVGRIHPGGGVVFLAVSVLGVHSVHGGRDQKVTSTHGSDQISIFIYFKFRHVIVRMLVIFPF